jgi:hypothetical protein
MNLPNYFLADLPRDAKLSPAMLTEACQTLKRNRTAYLKGRTTSSSIRLIADLAENWLHTDFPLRKLALEKGPEETGFSRATIERGMDTFFRQVTNENLRALITQDLGHSQRLDQFCAGANDLAGSRLALANGPELLFHITGGCLPNPVLTSLIQGILLRSAQIIRCASGTSYLPRLFAHSLYEQDGKLGSCIEIAEWPRASTELESSVMAEADTVTATGGDEAIQSILSRVPANVRFVSHSHRVSFAYISAEALSGYNPAKLAMRAAADVTAWNQLGCLSPHVIYVQSGGSTTAEYFAELLAAELAKCEESEPRGQVPPETSAIIASKRAFYEVRAAHSPDTRHWISPGSTAWTVIHEAEPKFQLSCLHRFIYVKSVTDVKQAIEAADAVRGKVSSVGIAALDEEIVELSEAFARWGVTRICPLGKMQEPHLLWRHDGRLSLAELVTWTDREIS